MTAWIAVDWGTSNLRAWAMGANNEVLEARGSEKGMGQLQSDQFEAALLELTEDWLTDGQVMPVVACGMVGAKTGWIQLLPSCWPPGTLRIADREHKH